MSTAHLALPATASRHPVTLAPAHLAWHRKLLRLIAGLSRRGISAEGAWASALPALNQMDEHLLDDVGAPQWAREAVRRQRNDRARAIEQILGGWH